MLQSWYKRLARHVCSSRSTTSNGAPGKERAPLFLAQETTRIGSGCFGDIYAVPESDVVLKVARIPRSADTEQKAAVYQKLEREEKFLRAAGTYAEGTMIQVPRSYGLFTEGHQGPFIAMQRIPLLSPGMDSKLRSLYYPGTAWSGQEPRHWRLYMGLDALPEEAAFFGGDDYPLLCREAEHVLRLPMQDVARDMGRFLARLTFAGGWLPNDVEFLVAGSAHVFCLDFEMLCSHSREVQEIVDGLYGSDPYYPQREDRFRDDFAAGYVGEAARLGHGKLASLVMNELHSRWLSDRCRLKL